MLVPAGRQPSLAPGQPSKDGVPIETTDSKPTPDLEESHETRVEHLGRSRPPTFASTQQEIAFVFSIVMSQILSEYFVSGFPIILPTLIKDLKIPASAVVWPASAFSLVIASTLLIFGRLGDMYGGYPVYLFGLAWMLLWSLVAGFSVNPLMLDFCRALQGLGAAAFLPTGVMLMGSVYRPGPRKNLVFSLYGTCAVVGFFIGIFFAGIVGQYNQWGAYFWIGAALTAATLTAAIFGIPNDSAARRKAGIKMDWLGAATTSMGLVLFVFAITESSHAPNGWRTAYIPTLLVLGIFLLGVAVYVEGWVAEQPLLPFDLFVGRSMMPLILADFFLYGTLGVFLLYGTQYFSNIMGVHPLQIVAWYIPMVVGGLTLSTAGGFLLHRLPSKPLLIMSGLGATGAALLLALVPVGGNYWAWIFPAMILGTVGIDIAINMTTIFMTTKLPSNRQGLAGGLVNSVLQLGLAVCLGFADIIQSETAKTVGLRRSYKACFWFAVAAGGVALLINTFVVTIPKARSDLTADEKAELEPVTRQAEWQRGSSASAARVPS